MIIRNVLCNLCFRRPGYSVINTPIQLYHNGNILKRITNYNFNYILTKRYAQNKPLKCWQCGIEKKNVTELFCEQCHHIQNPQDKNNYFKVFEMEEQFDVDQKVLREKYRKMQSMLHPDKFTTKSNQEKNISEEYSSLVNKAYDIIQTPLKRAIHLLSLKGEEVREGHEIDDPEFLMEIMELNEEVENADTDEKLITLKRENDSKLMQISEEINSCFLTDQLNKAKENIIKMKYYNRISNHINFLMREKGIFEN